MVCRGHDTRVSYQPFGNRGRLQSLEGEADGGVAGDLDLEAFAEPTEIPIRFEAFFTHEPVDRRRDHRLAVSEGLPAKPSRGHGPRGDRKRFVVDVRGRHGDLLNSPDV